MSPVRGGRAKGSRNWTEREIEYLEDKWGYKSVNAMARSLNRSPVAVILKAKRLGKTSIYTSGDYLSANRVARLMKVDIHTVTDYWIAKKGLKCSRKPMRLKRRIIIIRLDDLVDFLKNHPGLWDSRKLVLHGLGFEYEWLRGKRILDRFEPSRKLKLWTKAEDARALFLFYSQNKSLKEVSEIMGRSKGGVERRLSRIRVYKNKSMAIKGENN
jgi:hypothetical protein